MKVFSQLPALLATTAFLAASFAAAGSEAKDGVLEKRGTGSIGDIVSTIRSKGVSGTVFCSTFRVLTWGVPARWSSHSATAATSAQPKSTSTVVYTHLPRTKHNPSMEDNALVTAIRANWIPGAGQWAPQGCFTPAQLAQARRP
ncbi:hypothetical protein V8E36_004793 [Tilletia maclaganii]